MSKILLHTCCAPCTTYVNKWLIENNFEVKGFFYNPNIFPQEEYERRLLTMEHYATVIGMKVIYEPVKSKTLPGECEQCYVERLTKTAEKAKELGFDCFSTTLLISPYQKHELISDVGRGVGDKVGIEFFYQDFRNGYRASRQMAKEMKLYMQKYCGCGFDQIAKKEKVYAKVN